MIAALLMVETAVVAAHPPMVGMVDAVAPPPMVETAVAAAPLRMAEMVVVNLFTRRNSCPCSL
jgi:hypothetical protein